MSSHPKHEVAAFSVDAMRKRMMERVAVPEEMLNDAIKKTHAKLQARTTKFFTFQGQVIERVDVEDHAVQLQAADQIYSLSGLYARERDSRPAAPTVAVEVDAKTGVVRLLVGIPGGLAPAAPMSAAEQEQPALVGHDSVIPLSGSSLPPFSSDGHDAVYEEPPAQVVRVAPRRGELPDNIKKILFGEDGG